MGFSKCIQIIYILYTTHIPKTTLPSAENGIFASMSKVHIGKKVEEVVKKAGLTAIRFSKLMNMTRDGAYKIFAKEIIDTDQLNKISVVLKHDFFKYFSDELQMVQDPKDPFGFATKEELNSLGKSLEKSLENTIQKEFAKIREELFQKDGLKKKRKNK
jgi:hypothetical protein